MSEAFNPDEFDTEEDRGNEDQEREGGQDEGMSNEEDAGNVKPNVIRTLGAS